MANRRSAIAPAPDTRSTILQATLAKRNPMLECQSVPYRQNITRTLSRGRPAARRCRRQSARHTTCRPRLDLFRAR